MLTEFHRRLAARAQVLEVEFEKATMVWIHPLAQVPHGAAGGEGVVLFAAAANGDGIAVTFAVFIVGLVSPGRWHEGVDDALVFDEVHADVFHLLQSEVSDVDVDVEAHGSVYGDVADILCGSKGCQAFVEARLAVQDGGDEFEFAAVGRVSRALEASIVN